VWVQVGPTGLGILAIPTDYATIKREYERHGKITVINNKYKSNYKDLNGKLFT
jgi:hypothetical protein